MLVQVQSGAYGNSVDPNAVVGRQSNERADSSGPRSLSRFSRRYDARLCDRLLLSCLFGASVAADVSFNAGWEGPMSGAGYPLLSRSGTTYQMGIDPTNMAFRYYP